MSQTNVDNVPKWMIEMRYRNLSKKNDMRVKEYLNELGWDILDVGDTFNPDTDEMLTWGKVWDKMVEGLDYNDVHNVVQLDNYICRTPKKHKRSMMRTEGDRLMDFFFKK